MSFLLFSCLPLELRLQIWAYALPSPRVVIIRWHESWDHSRSPSLSRLLHGWNEGYERGFTSPTPNPSLLYVSRESRGVALRVFSLALGVHDLNDQPVVEKGRGKVYIDFELDTLLVDFRSAAAGHARLGPRPFSHYFRDVDRELICTLAICKMPVCAGQMVFVANNLMHFPRLRKVMLVTNHRHCVLDQSYDLEFYTKNGLEENSGVATTYWTEMWKQDQQTNCPEWNPPELDVVMVRARA